METAVQTDQKLAAIMFTDIISYTVMMSKNEQKTLSLLQEHNSLLREQFAKHSGNVIKETGDGFLTSFSSSLKSVKAAIAIQSSLYLHNSTQDIDDQINIRIGIHLAEIVNTDTNGSIDVLGEGVNISKRIEGFSEPNGGGLCFSQQIYDQVHNKIKNYPIESIGKKRLKGISRPYELYRVILPYQKSDIRSVGERKVKNSIAVLPFVNMSSDKENEYFADGITEELLNVMAKEKDLKVISRTSSFSYKGKDIPTKKIGRELNVEHILEGSVRTSGDRVRVTAQLIQVADSFHLWSDTYTRTLDDYFKIQDEIASKILTQLLDKIVLCENCNCTNNVEAHNLYLEGRNHWNQRSKVELEKAITCFEKCLEIDPTLSLAYSGLIDSWTLQAQRLHATKDEILPKCKDAIKKALELDDVSAELLASQSQIYQLEGEVEKSNDYLLSAIDVNPNLPTPHHWQSIRYADVGEFDKAIKHIDKAVALDPKSPIILFAAMCAYRAKSNVIKEKEFIQKTSELLPGFQQVEILLGNILVREYKWKDAKMYYLKLQKAKAYTDVPENKLSLLHNLYFLNLITNQLDTAQKLLEESEILLNLSIKDDNFEKIGLWIYGRDNLFISNFMDAHKYCSQFIEFNSDHELAYIKLAESLIGLEKYDEAFDYLNKAEKINKNTGMLKENYLFEIEYTRTLAYVMMHDLEKAYLGISKMKNMNSNRIPVFFNKLFIIYFAIGDLDKGFEWYQRQFEKPPSEYLEESCFDIIYNPWIKNVRKDPRYIDILKEMKLYDYWKDSL